VAFCGSSKPNIRTSCCGSASRSNLRFDSTALVFELDQAGKSPVVVFENVRGSGMQLVTNVAGNRKLLAACLGVTPGKPAHGVSRTLPDVIFPAKPLTVAHGRTW